MKKLGFLTAAIWVMLLMIMPQSGFAKMTAMSDSELRQITGQAGIAIQPEDIRGLNIDAERLAQNDGDYDSYYDVFAFSNASTGISHSELTDVDGEYAAQIVGDTDGVVGINMTIDDMDVYIDEMTADLRLGSSEASDSLGIFTMRGFRAHISGNVRIYTRQ
jgi:hypothetical protein